MSLETAFTFLGDRHGIAFDDYTLHERVDKDAFKNNHELKVRPPDGEVLYCFVYDK